MKITVELHGATKDLSKNNFLEFEIKKNSSIKDIKIADNWARLKTIAMCV